MEHEIWKNACWVYDLALDGVNAGRNSRVAGGLGGLAVAISPRLFQYVTSKGVIQGAREIWVCVENTCFGKMGILGIYAPNSSGDRTKLWQELFHTLDTSYRWILCGDFNMIENSGDQRGGACSLVAGREKRAWRHLKRHLLLEDSFVSRPGHLSFSWDNCRRFRHTPDLLVNPSGSRTLRRLDRVYRSSQKRNSEFNLESTILSGFSLSDHAPVLALFTFHRDNRRFTQHRMNSQHQTDPAFQEWIATMWAREEAFGRAQEVPDSLILMRGLKTARRMDRC